MSSAPKTLAWTFAVVTCPCHLFILTIVMAGTATGALLTRYFIPLLVVFSALFAISLVKALRT